MLAIFPKSPPNDSRTVLSPTLGSLTVLLPPQSPPFSDEGRTRRKLVHYALLHRTVVHYKPTYCFRKRLFLAHFLHVSKLKVVLPLVKNSNRDYLGFKPSIKFGGSSDHTRHPTHFQTRQLNSNCRVGTVRVRHDRQVGFGIEQHMIDTLFPMNLKTLWGSLMLSSNSVLLLRIENVSPRDGATHVATVRAQHPAWSRFNLTSTSSRPPSIRNQEVSNAS